MSALTHMVLLGSPPGCMCGFSESMLPCPLNPKPLKRQVACAGPGFSLTFSLGNCTFDDAAILSKDGALECFGPSVALQQTPLTFTSAYKQAASFTGEVGRFTLHKPFLQGCHLTLLHSLGDAVHYLQFGEFCNGTLGRLSNVPFVQV